MRLIAVPLARVRQGAPPVTTFLAQSSKAAQRATPSPSTASSSTSTIASKGGDAVRGSNGGDVSTIDKGKSPEKGSVAQKEGSGAESKLPLITRIMNKASDFWIGLGKEGQKSPFDWKRRTYNLGESLMDRIEYEEWALKGVDPTMGPSIMPREHNQKKSEKKQDLQKSEKVEDMIKVEKGPVAALNVPLLYPSSLLNSTGLLTSLTKMTKARQPHHRQRLIWCVVGMPLTIPFILIPVIPNLPFFYLVWRAWSHWRAFSSSKYLSELISQGRLVPTPSKELDNILALPTPSPTPKDKDTSGNQQLKEEKTESTSTKDEKESIDYESFLLLKPHTIKELVKEFDLEHQLSIELTRARQQTIKSIQRGQMDKLEEAAAGENQANKQ